MKLATFTHRSRTRIGVVAGDFVVDLAAAAPGLPADMTEFLGHGKAAMDAARQAAAAGGHAIALKDVRLEAPVPRPRKFLAIGMNYADHLEEMRRSDHFKNIKAPEHQIWFNKQVTCVNGPFDPIWRPKVSEQLDYEGELGLVIGKRCRHVPAGRARDAIAGFTVVNDGSVRDWQLRSPTFTVGKSFDTTGPMGPWLVTPDEIGDPHDLEIKTWVNGELRQHSNTRHLIFDCFEQVAFLSAAFTLEPGDVLSTGTPHGVGAFMSPPAWLKAGDTVRIEIEKIGAIENRVIDEPADSARF